ncbi:MAG: hypothetical protein AAGA54_28385 [Myxococcota bacterium]
MTRAPLASLPFLFVTVLGSSACSLFGGGDGDGSGSSGGATMPQPMFEPGCEEPSTGTAITCANFCDKLSLCTAGLCANQLSEPALCDGTVSDALQASCLATCDETALQNDQESVSCLFENTCAAVFIDKVCDPTASLECDGMATTTTTSSATTDSTTTSATTAGSECPWEFDGECDEPEGTGFCPEGSDPDDCEDFGGSTFGDYTFGGSTYGDETGTGTSTGFGTTGGTSGTSTGF